MAPNFQRGSVMPKNTVIPRCSTALRNTLSQNRSNIPGYRNDSRNLGF